MAKGDKLTIFIAIACISALLCLICMGCLLTKSVELSVDCFAVDSAGKLYVGSNGRICVYDNRKCLYVIDEYRGIGDVPVKGAIFTITSDDMITMVTGGYVVTMDLMGNVQEMKEDNASSIRGKMERKKNTFVSPNGDIYTKQNVLGRTCIQKNGNETVYQTSFGSLLIKSMLVIAVLGFVGAVPAIIVLELREQMTYR